MAYLGKSLDYGTLAKQVLTTNGSTVVFALDHSVDSGRELFVSVGGVIQEPEVVYSASGTTLTFTTAPAAAHRVWIVFLGRELSDASFTSAVMTSAKFQNDSVTSDKINTMSASKLTGAMPAISGAGLTGISTDLSAQEENIALLGFKMATNENLATYDLVDQVTDEYYDATGIVAYNGTPEVAAVAAAYDTSDRSSSITVTHSGFSAWGEGQPNSGLVDGLNADQYQAGSRFVFAVATPSAGAYIRFQHSSAKIYTEVKWYGSTSANGTWKWQGSNDGTTFTDIGGSFTLGGTGWGGSVATTVQTQTSMSANTTAYIYYQLAWVSGATNGNDYQADCQFKSAAVDAVAATPGTGSSSSATAGGSNPAKYYSGSTTGTTAGTYSGTYTSAAYQGLFFNADASYTLGTGDFTLEWFQKTTSAQVSQCGIIGQTNEVAWTSTAYHVGYHNNNIIWGSGSPSISNTFTFGSSSHDDAWHHMALVRDSGTLRAYRDGVASGTTVANTTSYGLPANRLAVGAQHGGGSESYNGLLDGVRVSTVCRYPSGTTFTPSQTYASDANTSLYLDFERADFSGVRGANSAYAYISNSGPQGGNDNRAPVTRTADNGQGGVDTAVYSDMDLVSTTTTALTVPATGSIVTLIENSTGTATLNTDIKGYVSRDGGTGWDQVTLADKGTWGTNKKILTGMDTTFSNSASGTDMKYKIETANQSSGKQTRVHATSLAWKA